MFFDEMPIKSFALKSFGLYICFCYHFVMFRNIIHFLLVLCAVFLVLILSDKVDLGDVGADDGVVAVHFLDIGQGAGVLVDVFGSNAYLFDSGRDNRVLDRVADVYHGNVINAIFASHPDADHIGGLNFVLKKFVVGTVFYNGFIPDTQTSERFVELARKRSRLVEISGGNYVDLDSDGKARAYVVFPIYLGMFDGDNNNSLVVLVDYGEFEVLITGDIEKEAQKYIVENGLLDGFGHIEVVQVPHHGSKTGALREFYEYIDPDVAVIQAGVGNSYGHPHKVVLDMLDEIGIDYLCTCVVGGVSFLSDGNGYDVVTER